MKKFGYYFAVLRQKFHLHCKGKDARIEFFRKNGIKIGEHAKIYSNIVSSEPYLIEIGDNVTISHDVTFVTHDNSVCKLFGYDRDLYGKIIIGNNCFIGAHAILMYGVTLPDNTIVGAGSVVTKSPKEGGVVIGGNPAKVICKWNEFRKKVEDNVVHAGYLNLKDKKNKVLNEGKLIIK